MVIVVVLAAVAYEELLSLPASSAELYVESRIVWKTFGRPFRVEAWRPPSWHGNHRTVREVRSRGEVEIVLAASVGRRVVPLWLRRRGIRLANVGGLRQREGVGPHSVLVAVAMANAVGLHG